MDKEKLYYFVKEGTNYQCINPEGNTPLIVDAEHVDQYTEEMENSSVLHRFKPITIQEYEDKFE